MNPTFSFTSAERALSAVIEGLIDNSCKIKKQPQKKRRIDELAEKNLSHTVSHYTPRGMPPGTYNSQTSFLQPSFSFHSAIGNNIKSNNIALALADLPQSLSTLSLYDK